MRQTEKSLRKTAYHEAGHVVAAVVEGIRFRSVTIRPDADTLGRVMFRKWPVWAMPDSPRYNQQRARSWFESRARIALAGRMAEEYHTKQLAPRHTHAQDYRAVVNFAYEVCGFKDECDAWIEYLYLGARNRLIRKPYWAAVRALANELMKQKTIGEAEARRIIASALR